MPQRLIYLALHNDYSEDFSPTTELPEDRCGQIAVKRLLAGSRGHFGPLEHPSLSLMLQVDHNTAMQLRTHRIGLSFDLQSMRYTGERIEKVARGELSPRSVFYCRPAGTYRDRQGDPYAWTEQHINNFWESCILSAQSYLGMRAWGASEEHARQLLITSYLQNMVITGNARSWLHLLDVRLKADAQDEARWAMDLVAHHISRWIPEIYAWWESHRKGKAILAP
jgi:thymidylate synthase (FAD)